ncbi:hypothetical protein NGH03_23800, partial [Escherichia coli]|nr:hypothetical protein [Escherichia coli]
GAILVTEPEEILENLQFGLHWLPDAPENSFYSPDQQDVALPFIKQGAILVTEPEEILENLQFGLHWLPDAPENSFYSPDQQDVA